MAGMRRTGWHCNQRTSLRGKVSLPLPAKRERPLRLVDIELKSAVGIAQQSSRRSCVRAHRGLLARQCLLQYGLDGVCANSEKGAAEAELHLAVAPTQLRSELRGQVRLLLIRHQ